MHSKSRKKIVCENLSFKMSWNKALIKQKRSNIIVSLRGLKFGLEESCTWDNFIDTSQCSKRKKIYLFN